MVSIKVHLYKFKSRHENDRLTAARLIELETIKNVNNI